MDEFLNKINRFAAASSDEEYMDSYIENRIKSFVYYSFFLFEAQERDIDAIINTYADEFEVSYPWGGCKTREQLVKWVSNIPVKGRYAHHVKDLKIIKNTNKEVIECQAEVTYQTLNEQGEFKSMNLHYDFVILYQGGIPKISKSITTISK